jgi:hypothetical protein
LAGFGGWVVDCSFAVLVGEACCSESFATKEVFANTSRNEIVNTSSGFGVARVSSTCDSIVTFVCSVLADISVC